MDGTGFGLGTSTPSKELTVEGSISASDDLYLDGHPRVIASSGRTYISASSDSSLGIFSGDDIGHICSTRRFGRFRPPSHSCGGLGGPLGPIRITKIVY